MARDIVGYLVICDSKMNVQVARMPDMLHAATLGSCPCDWFDGKLARYSSCQNSYCWLGTVRVTGVDSEMPDALIVRSARSSSLPCIPRDPLALAGSCCLPCHCSNCQRSKLFRIPAPRGFGDSPRRFLGDSPPRLFPVSEMVIKSRRSGKKESAKWKKRVGEMVKKSRLDLVAGRSVGAWARPWHWTAASDWHWTAASDWKWTAASDWHWTAASDWQWTAASDQDWTAAFDQRWTAASTSRRNSPDGSSIKA